MAYAMRLPVWLGPTQGTWCLAAGHCRLLGCSHYRTWGCSTAGRQCSANRWLERIVLTVICCPRRPTGPCRMLPWAYYAVWRFQGPW